MGKKDTIQSIIDRLATIPCVNQDGSTVTLNTMIWSGQRDDQKDMLVYAKPACFVEVEFNNGQPIGEGATSYECIIRVMIEQEQYNTEGSITTELSLLDLPDNVHRYLNKFKPDYCSPFIQINSKLDYTSGNTNFAVFEYASTFVDLIGSTADETAGYFITDTLTDPILTMEENVYIGALPDDGGDGSSDIGGGGILPGYGLGASVWRDGAGVPSNTIGNNGDYYLNDTNGDVYHKEAGVYVLVANIKGEDGAGGGGSAMEIVVVQGDGTIVVEPFKAYEIRDGILTMATTVDLTQITNEGDYFEIYNMERNQILTFNADVYRYNDAFRQLDGEVSYKIRLVDGKFRQ